MSPHESIIVDDVRYQISELTEFGFAADLNLSAADKQARQLAGTLEIGNDQFEVEFRVRRSVGDKSFCSWHSLSIDTGSKIKTYLKRRHRQGDSGLEERSYDELANGLTDSSDAGAGVATATSSGNAGTPAAKGHVKTFALLLMLLAGLAMVVVALVFMRSRSTLGVANSALIGNSVRVNSKVAGEIAEVLVREGDVVQKGDVLIRLENPELSSELSLLLAQSQTAKAKVKALTKQKEVFADKLVFASKKLDLERQVAESELKAAKRSVQSAKLGYERFRPHVRTGAVTQIELDEVERRWMAEESNYIAKENRIREIDFAITAAKNNVLILGDRVDDVLGRIESELAVARAEVIELEQACKITAAREKELEIVAPRDGTVYVNYRQQGEFIKVADELIGISYPGETWAAGQVSSGQASRVFPGQPVTIRIPSMKQNIEGIVMAVGHRAMYSKGNYNAEFRGAVATDVPVKVYIKDLPENVPSGIRLTMAIKTGYGIEWLDDAMGYKLLSIGSQAEDGSKAPEQRAESNVERLASVTFGEDKK